MLKAVCFFLGNGIAAWGLAHFLGSQLQYPPELPLRVQPLLPALSMAVVFSLLGLPVALLKPGPRVAAILLTVPLAIAAAGALCLPLNRVDGALMALLIAQNSTLVSLAGTGWALMWSLIVFRPVKPPPERPPAPPREELPISDQWSGAER